VTSLFAIVGNEIPRLGFGTSFAISPVSLREAEIPCWRFGTGYAISVGQGIATPRLVGAWQWHRRLLPNITNIQSVTNLSELNPSFLWGPLFTIQSS